MRLSLKLTLAPVTSNIFYHQIPPPTLLLYGRQQQMLSVVNPELDLARFPGVY